MEAADSDAEIVHCKYGDGQKKVTVTVNKGSGADNRKCRRDPGKNPEKTQRKHEALRAPACARSVKRRAGEREKLPAIAAVSAIPAVATPATAAATAIAAPAASATASTAIAATPTTAT